MGLSKKIGKVFYFLTEQGRQAQEEERGLLGTQTAVVESPQRFTSNDLYLHIANMTYNDALFPVSKEVKIAVGKGIHNLLGNPADVSSPTNIAAAMDYFTANCLMCDPRYKVMQLVLVPYFASPYEEGTPGNLVISKEIDPADHNGIAAAVEFLFQNQQNKAPKFRQPKVSQDEKPKFYSSLFSRVYPHISERSMDTYNRDIKLFFGDKDNAEARGLFQEAERDDMIRSARESFSRLFNRAGLFKKDDVYADTAESSESLIARLNSELSPKDEQSLIAMFDNMTQVRDTRYEFDQLIDNLEKLGLVEYAGFRGLDIKLGIGSDRWGGVARSKRAHLRRNLVNYAKAVCELKTYELGTRLDAVSRVAHQRQKANDIVISLFLSNSGAPFRTAPVDDLESITNIVCADTQATVGKVDSTMKLLGWTPEEPQSDALVTKIQYSPKVRDATKEHIGRVEKALLLFNIATQGERAQRQIVTLNKMLTYQGEQNKTHHSKTRKAIAYSLAAVVISLLGTAYVARDEILGYLRGRVVQAEQERMSAEAEAKEATLERALTGASLEVALRDKAQVQGQLSQTEQERMSAEAKAEYERQQKHEKEIENTRLTTERSALKQQIDLARKKEQEVQDKLLSGGYKNKEEFDKLNRELERRQNELKMLLGKDYTE